MKYVPFFGLAPLGRYVSALFLLVAPLLFSVQVLSAQTALPAPEIARQLGPSIVRVIALLEGEEIGQGSGFVVQSDGTIITNRHVVENATELRVELSDGDIYDNVYVVNVDERRDLLMLKVPAVGLTSVTLGDDKAVEVGDAVYAMGHPKGMGMTFSDGIVSGTPSLDGVAILQITAPISPGSSGGPVINDRGEVVGVATAYLQDAQNLNLAVPSRYVEGLLSIDAEVRSFADVASMFASVEDATSTSESDAEPWARVLLEEVERVNEAVRDQGLKRVSEVTYGILAPNEAREFQIKVGGNATAVAVIGVCDIDCSDLDLAIYDENGTLITVDNEPDDRPLVGAQVGGGRTVTVTAVMASCSTETCGVALQVFAEPASAR